jgi:hypothetical protein
MTLSSCQISNAPTETSAPYCSLASGNGRRSLLSLPFVALIALIQTYRQRRRARLQAKVIAEAEAMVRHLREGRREIEDDLDDEPPPAQTVRYTPWRFTGHQHTRYRTITEASVVYVSTEAPAVPSREAVQQECGWCAVDHVECLGDVAVTPEVIPGRETFSGQDEIMPSPGVLYSTPVKPCPYTPKPWYSQHQMKLFVLGIVLIVGGFLLMGACEAREWAEDRAWLARCRPVWERAKAGDLSAFKVFEDECVDFGPLPSQAGSTNGPEAPGGVAGGSHRQGSTR